MLVKKHLQLKMTFEAPFEATEASESVAEAIVAAALDGGHRRGRAVESMACVAQGSHNRL